MALTLDGTAGISTTGNILSSAGIISATGNIYGGNIIGAIAPAAITVAGNATAGNLITGGLISATGNITTVDFGQHANLIITGARSANINVAGVAIRTVTSTYTDNTALGVSTVADNHINVLATPALAAANSAVTTTRSATLYIAGAPSPSTNMTITNAYALYVAAGNVLAIANVTGGNLLTGGAISATGNVTGNYLLGNAYYVTGLSPTQIYNGTSQINIGASNGNANITIGATSNVAVFATTGEYISGVLSATGNITGGNLATAGVVTVNSGSAATAIVNGGSNGVGNIGASGAGFNTIFAKATTAQYADLAEMYVADGHLDAGMVVEFGGDKEIRQTYSSHSTAVAGVVSTNPSYLMNSNCEGEFVYPIALTGRVPCWVVGTIRKGDRLVSSKHHGVATVMDPELYQPGCIIGKALEDYDSLEIGRIEVVVGRT